MIRPLLVFGSGGQIGRELLETAGQRGVTIVGVLRADADITDRHEIETTIARVNPRLVVNAAAYTAVDKAESESERAFAVNAIGAETVARAAAAASVPVLHISTDFVFDGCKSDPYVETDRVAPLSVYGSTKEAGEVRVRAAAPNHVMLRTAWLYGIYGHNFLKLILRAARDRDELRVVADQCGCPTASADLAEAILAVDAKVAAGARPWGTYHFVGTGATTRHGFASAIVAAQAGFTGRRPPVRAIRTEEWPTPARRPANSVLDTGLFVATFGYRAPPWQQRMTDAVASLMAAATN